MTRISVAPNDGRATPASMLAPSNAEARRRVIVPNFVMFLSLLPCCYGPMQQQMLILVNNSDC
jgi:hypothetical protein